MAQGINIAVNIIHRDVRHCKVCSTVDTHHLYGRVFEIEAGDRRLLQGMGVEELWLDFASV